MFAVIVNPVSGGGEAVRLAIRISERIAAMGQESRLFETSGDGDAARQTRAAVEAGCEAVVCIGGDGTNLRHGAKFRDTIAKIIGKRRNGSIKCQCCCIARPGDCTNQKRTIRCRNLSNLLRTLHCFNQSVGKPD